MFPFSVASITTSSLILKSCKVNKKTRGCYEFGLTRRRKEKKKGSWVNFFTVYSFIARPHYRKGKHEANISHSTLFLLIGIVSHANQQHFSELSPPCTPQPEKEDDRVFSKRHYITLFIQQHYLSYHFSWLNRMPGEQSPRMYCRSS